MFACKSSAQVCHTFVEKGCCPGNTINFCHLSNEASENGSIRELTLKPQSGNGDSCTCSPACLCLMCLCRAHQCLPATGTTSCVWGVPASTFYYTPGIRGRTFPERDRCPRKVQPGPDCLLGRRFGGSYICPICDAIPFPYLKVGK